MSDKPWPPMSKEDFEWHKKIVAGKSKCAPNHYPDVCACLFAEALEAYEAAVAEAERLRAALQQMLSADTDWENGQIGVGYRFRGIARDALEGRQP